jgi:hypothetical protein
VPGSFGYAIWLIGTLLEAAVVVCALAKHSFHRYFCLNLYMSTSVLVSIGRFVVLEKYGFLSPQYAYVWQYTDVLLTIFLYFALITLYSQVFDEMKAEKIVRLTAVLLLLGTAVFSYSVVQQSQHRMLSHFFFELSQNLYFVGLVLTYVLWGAILKLRETRVRLIQLVLSLGMYFSVSAASYALRNLSSPSFQSVWAYLPPIFSCLLPLAWAYAFWRLPEEARLAPSRLAVVPR